jgi:multicomponent K+:H+ antiporter subunit G
MTETANIPILAEIITAALLIGGALITLIGSLGLLKLGTFYQRVHAPTLGTTLGTACIAAASMVYFSVLGSRPVLHEILIVIFITVTTPVTLTILVRAALLRDHAESDRDADQKKEPAAGLIATPAAGFIVGEDCRRPTS